MHRAKPRHFDGGCHCGAIWLFFTAIAPAALTLRHFPTSLLHQPAL